MNYELNKVNYELNKVNYELNKVNCYKLFYPSLHSSQKATAEAAATFSESTP